MLSLLAAVLADVRGRYKVVDFEILAMQTRCE
jgi:hypothetical protein